MITSVLIIATFLCIGYSIARMAHHSSITKNNNCDLGITLLIVGMATSVFALRIFEEMVTHTIEMWCPAFYQVFLLQLIALAYLTSMVLLNWKTKRKFYRYCPLLLQAVFSSATSLLLYKDATSIFIF